MPRNKIPTGLQWPIKPTIKPEMTRAEQLLAAWEGSTLEDLRVALEEHRRLLRDERSQRYPKIKDINNTKAGILSIRSVLLLRRTTEQSSLLRTVREA